MRECLKSEPAIRLPGTVSSSKLIAGMMLVASVRNGPKQPPRSTCCPKREEPVRAEGRLTQRRFSATAEENRLGIVPVPAKPRTEPPIPRTGLPSDKRSQVEYAFQFAELFLVGDAELHGRVDFEKRKNTFPPSVDDPV